MSDTKTPSPSPETDTKALPASKAKRHFRLKVIAPIVLIILVVGYFQYQTFQLSNQAVELKRTQTLLQQRLTAQVSRNSENKALLKQTTAQLQEADEKMRAMNDIIQQLPGARSEDWKLAEVEYLLRLANQRVLLQQEGNDALALLQAAYDILAELDDPSLFTVRKRLSSEMLALGKGTQFDREGTYLKIEALKSDIQKRVTPPENFQLPTTAALDTNEPSQTDINTQSFWQSLLSLVKVRHRDEAFEAPLRASQYQLLQHSLILMLEQSQWALLKQDQALYERALGNAETWIDGKLRHLEAEALLKAIRALKALSITQAYPDISGSLRQLRSIIKDRTYRPDIPPKDDETPSQSNDQHTPSPEGAQA